MFDPARLDRIADWMQGYVDERKFPGCSVLIEGQGTERYFHATGARDIETGAPFLRDTIVRLYSMTKPVTSAIFMMLVEEGKVHLEARLSDYVPAFADLHALVPGATSIDQTEPAQAPTMQNLLTHTSGLTYAFNPGPVPKAMEEAEVFFAPAQGTLAAMTDKLASLPLAFQPGTRWEYSVGIDVIGRVIEVIEGKPLDQVFRERILVPLDMVDTHFAFQDATLERCAHLYTPLAGNAMGLNDAVRGSDTLRLADDVENSQLCRTTLFSGGGGLVGTIDDYMAFCRFLQSGQAGDMRLLAPSTLRFMQSNHLGCEIAAMGPQSFAEQPMRGMGFGIGGAVVLDAGRAGTPGHMGDYSWGGMASTFFWIDPVADLSVVFLTQLSPSSSYPGRPQLKALVHGALL